MKHEVIKKMIALLFASTLLLAWVGCTKEESPTIGGEGSELPVFDFSTKASYTLNVKYSVPKGYKVYFEVYAENPLMTTESGQRVVKSGLQPIDKGYTNENGVYSNRLLVSSFVQDVYVYTPNAGVPELLKATVTNGVLSDAGIFSTFVAGVSAASSATRSGDWYSKVDYPGVTTKVLGRWEHYVDGYASLPNNKELFDGRAKLWGRPDYLSYVDQTNFTGGKPVLQLNADVWQTINAALPGRDKPQDQFDILDNGDIHITKQTSLDICILDERGLYMNVLGYYCYPTDSAPTSVSDIKVQTIVFPNAKMIRSHNYYAPGSDIMDFGALCRGEGVRLRYIDQQGVDHGETFPAGVSVGWVLYADGYKFGGMGSGAAGVGKGAIYSDPILTNGMAHVALFRHGESVVLAFEDGVKTSVTDARDYDDVMFSVVPSDPEAIIPDIPNKEPEKPENLMVTYYGILLFEDIWPYRGDFDMNDVVIKYVSTVEFNANNEVVGTVEEYTPLWSGASLNNSFAYRNPNLASATVTFKGGDGAATVDSGDKTIIRLASNLLDYANQLEKKTFTVTTKYTTPITRINYVFPPYNPFITVGGVESHEVHLTNMKPTSYADMSLLGTGHDKSQPEKGLYYITYDEQNQQMPFGIDIVLANEEAIDAFVILKENAGSINTYYPAFMSWILSGGRDNKDWYLHPVKTE